MNVQQGKARPVAASVAAARRTASIAVGCLLGALVLGGCGQKGPLKLAPAPAASTASAPAR